MLLRLLIAFVFGGVSIPLFILIAFDGVYTLGNWMDAGFIIGMIMFSFGLIMATNAGKLFRGIGFVAKKLVSGKYAHYSYFDYLSEKGEDKDKTTGFPWLIVGGLILAVAVTVSYLYLDLYI